jgi:tRNA (cmo5U34)-methyltransferase
VTDKSRDRVFARQLSDIRAFEFNDAVADVFEDMISRSVPGYPLLLRMIDLYAAIFVQPGSRIYDLGCSLGEAARLVAERTDDVERELIAVDNSAAMIEKCRSQHAGRDDIEWRCEDILQTPIDNASMVILNLTLQFLPPAQRRRMLEKIFDGLNPGGVLVLSEKVVFDDAGEDERMRELHLAFKKTMGYSDLEISQKRTALENVLIPDAAQAHIERLQAIGFAEVYLCFRCFNFVSYLAIKA